MNRRRSLARLHRFVAGLLTVVAVSAALAVPAGAHGGGDDTSTNFSSELIDGGAPCLSWDILANDGYLELTSRCPGTVTVFGYQDEPYLELSEDGVRENLRSPAAYLNRDATGRVVVPADADPAAEPDWVIRSPVPRYRWHDHRIHWMGGADPPGLEGRTLVSQWSIPLLLDETGGGGFRLEAVGELWWTPPPAWWPPVTATAVVALAVFAWFAQPSRRVAGAARATDAGADDGADDGDAPGEPVWPGLGRAMGVVMAVVALGAVAFTVDDVIIARSVGERVVAVAVGLVVVGLAGAAAWRARVGDATAMFALAGGGLALTWGYGVFNRDLLTSSQIDGRLPDPVLRVIVSAALVVAVPMVLSLVLFEWSRRGARTVAARRASTA